MATRNTVGGAGPHAIPDRAPVTLAGFVATFQYSHRAFRLAWSTSRTLTQLYGLSTIVAGLLPAAIAYVGKWIVDAVIAAAKVPSAETHQQLLLYVLAEAGLVLLLTGAQRGQSVLQSLLRAQLGQRVNVLILEKALTLDLAQFEDSEFYDKLVRAQREASVRPLSLINRSFGLVQNAVSLTAYTGLLFKFSPLAVAILLATAIPAFVVEAKFSGDAFRLFRWRSPERRQQIYLETVIAREDYAKEVKLFELAPTLLERYRTIFGRLYREDRDLTLKRGLWAYLLGIVSTGGFYGAYAWMAAAAARGTISIGELTMYLLVFKEGQSAVSASLSSIGGMYEDNLYLSTLYEYLEQPTAAATGTATVGASPGDGIRFEHVTFRYQGGTSDAVHDVSFRLKPGEKLAIVGDNGSGKTTLIKLLTRLYAPTSGRILLDGTDLREWDEASLRKRIGVIFQDFVRYQFIVGENIGAGDITHFDDESRWQKAAELGMAAPFIDHLPQGYHTQLGKWFHGGQELSGGQWQKIALSRAFARTAADVLVLDEPTAAMDAEAEANAFEHFRATAQKQMAILISHRFSTVRKADRIVVLGDGRVIEEGTHDELMRNDGRYARLFSLQAEGYR